MTEFVCVGDVPAIPSDKKVAAMKRSDSQMKGVTARVVRHHMIRDVRLDRFGNGIIQVEKRESASQFEHIRSVWKLPSVQFVLNGKARDQLV
jgi:hypothetical protein